MYKCDSPHTIDKFSILVEQKGDKVSMKNVDLFPVQGCATCGHSLCAKKVSLFSHLHDDQIKEIIQLIERRHLKKGDVALHVGELYDRLYIVNKGTLKASTYQEDGKEQILYLLNDGDCIGELALLKSEHAVYDLIAVRESFICTIPKSKFDAYLRTHPEIMFSIMASAHEKIASLEKLVGAIASNDADIRLKFLIRQLIERSGKDNSHTITIKLNLTREDMANFVGVTRETISRKLSQLAHEGILEFEDSKKIKIMRRDYFN